MKPACMDIAEYVAWCEKNEQLATMSDRAKTPCDDCLTSHALEMRDIHKCYAWVGERYVIGRPRGYEDDSDVILDRQQLAIAAARKKKNAVRAIAIREAVRLTDLGLSLRETATLMGCSPSAVSKYRSDRGKVE